VISSFGVAQDCIQKHILAKGIYNQNIPIFEQE
jgi:hypothetical protein